MQPGLRVAVGIQPGAEILCTDRMQVAMPDIVFTRPGDLDRLATLTSQPGGLGDEIRFRFATEPAAQQRHVDRNLFLIEAQCCGYRIARGLRVLCTGPYLATAVRIDTSGCCRWLHRCLRQVRRVVNCFMRFCRSNVGVAAVQNHGARGGGRVDEFFLVTLAVVSAVRTTVPLDGQCVSTFGCGPGVRGEHGDTALDVEKRGRGRLRHTQHVDNTGHGARRSFVVSLDRSAECRATLNGCEQHVRQHRVNAIHATTGCERHAVNGVHRLADVAIVFARLECRGLRLRHVFCRIDKFAVTR